MSGEDHGMCLWHVPLITLTKVESPYAHKKMKRFLEVYVDDIHVAGREENLSPMWKKLKEVNEVDPPVPFHENTYLGCTQRKIKV